MRKFTTTKKLTKVGTSDSVLIPVMFKEYLDIKTNDELIVSAEESKYGKFIAIFKKKEGDSD